MDEREYAEAILSSGMSVKKPAEALSVLSRYFYSQGMNQSEISKELENYMIRANEDASLPKWQSTIEKYARSAGKYKLVEIDHISITKKEFDTISKIHSVPLQRLAFTLLCIAKFYNASSSSNNNWVNKPDKEFFKLANIQTSCLKQSLMINDLYTMGLIGYSKVVDNTNINVKFVDNKGVAELDVFDFRNLGNQYMRYKGFGKFVECESCGLVIRKTNNRLKYCKECAVEIDRKKSISRWKKAGHKA